ncbi:hypothetical protein D3C81_2174830 [compost metagenome]
MFCNHFIRGFRSTTAASGSGHFHALALFTLNTNLADWLKAFGNIVVGRSLSADTDSP